MLRKAAALATTILLATLYCNMARGQALPPTILNIDVENSVQYFKDTSDLSKFATDPGPTTPNPAKNCGKAFEIDDIVAVNRQPAKGTIILSWRTMALGPTPAPGGAIADITRNNIIDVRVELQKSDGTPVGSLMATGLGAGSPPPGAPLDVVQGNNANGRNAEVLAAVAFPGAVEGYQVNFRVPSDAAKGNATIQVSAAWMVGQPVSIAIQ